MWRSVRRSLPPLLVIAVLSATTLEQATRHAGSAVDLAHVSGRPSGRPAMRSSRAQRSL